MDRKVSRHNVYGRLVIVGRYCPQEFDDVRVVPFDQLGHELAGARNEYTPSCTPSLTTSDPACAADRRVAPFLLVRERSYAY